MLCDIFKHGLICFEDPKNRNSRSWNRPGRGGAIPTNTAQPSFKFTVSPPPPCWFTLRPGGWRHYVPTKRWTTTLHGVTSRKIAIFNVKPLNAITRTFQASQWGQEGTSPRKFRNDVSFTGNGDKTRVNRWLTDTKQGTTNCYVYVVSENNSCSQGRICRALYIKCNLFTRKKIV
jgi:hypothetical protein